jgi:acyl dehydratase
MKEIRFDDIDTLRSMITETWGDYGASVQITQEMINAFADLTGDRQWIHVDVERCKKESPFGGPIAHGMLTLSLLGKMRPSAPYSLVGYSNVTNYGSDGFRFAAPVPVNSTLHARMRLIAVEAKPKGTLITNEVSVEIVGGSDKPALVYKGVIMYQGAR